MYLFIRRAGLGLAALAALAGCRKDKFELEGPVPTPAFTTKVDASQYPATVTFTNTSSDAFLYQWEFGDGERSSAPNTTHVYKSGGGTYRVKLTVSGRGGTGISPEQAVLIPDLCGSNAAFKALTDCGGSSATSWIYSDQPGAIRKFASDGTTLLSASTTLPACQEDDEFSFTGSFSYSYSAGALKCGNEASGNYEFSYRPGTNQIVLTDGALGVQQPAQNRAYTIVEGTKTRLRLRSTNADGTITEVTLRPQLSKLERTKQALTGGSSRTWTLDNTVDGTISVGIEANPGRDYVSGVAGSIPDCQADDEYTFTTTNDFKYDALAQTFVAGDYTCQAPRSTQTTYTFEPAVGAGDAQFTLSKPGTFIGVTDAPASRVYRIIAIDNKTMTLRAGRPTDPAVFTFKMKVK